MKIVFFGTSDFAAKVLLQILEDNFDVCAVITMKDKPKGRGRNFEMTPVKKAMMESSKYNFVDIHQPEKASNFIDVLSTYNADIFLVVAYGEIFSKKLLAVPKIMPINIHSSLLPKYRGAAPIQHSILHGEKVTGISIMKMAFEIDSGEILCQKSIDILPDETFGELESRLCQLSKSMIVDVLKSIENENYTLTPQGIDKKGFYAHKISTNDCKIQWNNSSQNVHNIIRAFSPKPGAWSFAKIDNEVIKVKIFDSEVFFDDDDNLGVCDIDDKFTDDGGCVIQCGSGKIKAKTIQLPGKRAMTFKEFFNGIKSKFVFLNDVEETIAC